MWREINKHQFESEQERSESEPEKHEVEKFFFPTVEKKIKRRLIEVKSEYKNAVKVEKK